MTLELWLHRRCRCWLEHDQSQHSCANCVVIWDAMKTKAAS